jgi:signal transduction histidine kinase
MRRALVTTVIACLLGAGALAVSSGAHAGLETLELLLAVSAGALAAAAAARRARRWIGPLHRQLALAVGIALGAILAAVWVAAGVMFISSDDALVVSVMAAVIAAVGLSIANLLTAPMVKDIERLRRRLRAVGAGDRSADLATGGNDELAGLAGAANAMIERLAEEEAGRSASEDARRRLMIAVSHDLRTPLAALRVLTEAVEDRIVTGATRTRYLKEMQTHVTVLSALIDDLFELSRAQAGELTLERRPVEIGELVSETVAAMRAAGEGRGVRLAAEPPTGQTEGPPLAAHADPEQIRRVLLNLLDNAIRHTPPGGSVVARVSRRDGEVEVEVADDGSGIAPREREHVFEAFYRGGAHVARTEDGAGLGLAIAQAIVGAHGGEIWLAPAHPGTRVCFSLPASGRLAPRASEPAPTAVRTPARQAH